MWYGIVPDEYDQIVAKLTALCDSLQVDAVLTTGGTGLAPRDVTPEATLHVAERQVPGISEAIRSQSAAKAKNAMLSRGVSVTRGSTLIINFPCSPKAVRESMDAFIDVIGHGLRLLLNTDGECART